MMFFKVIYYLIGLVLVAYKTHRLTNKEINGDLYDVWRCHEEEKKKGNKLDWKEVLSEELRNKFYIFAGFVLLEITWIGVGLFTYNWLLFLGFFIYSFLFNRVMKNRIEKYKSVFISTTNMNLVIGIGIILFAIINTFHLHIDLFKLIFGGI